MEQKTYKQTKYRMTLRREYNFESFFKTFNKRQEFNNNALEYSLYEFDTLTV